MSNLNEDRQTLTVSEAAALLGIGRNTAYEGVRRGQIPAIKIGRRLLIPRAALEAVLARGGRVEESADPPRERVRGGITLGAGGPDDPDAVEPLWASAPR